MSLRLPRCTAEAPEKRPRDAFGRQQGGPRCSFLCRCRGDDRSHRRDRIAARRSERRTPGCGRAPARNPRWPERRVALAARAQTLFAHAIHGGRHVRKAYPPNGCLTGTTLKETNTTNYSGTREIYEMLNLLSRRAERVRDEICSRLNAIERLSTSADTYDFEAIAVLSGDIQKALESLNEAHWRPYLVNHLPQPQDFLELELREHADSQRSEGNKQKTERLETPADEVKTLPPEVLARYAEARQKDRRESGLRSRRRVYLVHDSLMQEIGNSLDPQSIGELIKFYIQAVEMFEPGCFESGASSFWYKVDRRLSHAAAA